MSELVFYRGTQELIRYPLTGEVKIGRHPANDLTLPDEEVSRFHCTLFQKEGVPWLKDQSRNGTYLNGQRVKIGKLKEGDQIRIGPWSVRYFAHDQWADRETAVEKKRPPSFFGIVGEGPKMKEVFSLVEKLAPLETAVLVMGETGTGKELVARALHSLSPRAGHPFVAINCGAISPHLVESELFGHEKGAFTGALERHPGAFEQAGAGTLFLDEIGELPLELQPKLLRVLEDQVFRRVGGKEEVKIRARLIAATHRNLPQQVKAGKFREDLFYRLYTVPVPLPPLRDRPEDIPFLVDYFLSELHPQGDKELTEQALEKLKCHAWQGNVRELRNTVLRALLLSTGSVIGEDTIQFPLATEEGAQSLDSVEREAILKALRGHQGNKTRAALSLGIAKSTLFQKIKEYGIKD